MIEAPLIILSLVGILSSVGMFVASNTFYRKLGTFHETELLGRNNRDGNEPGYEKLGKLWLYNFIIGISVTALVIVYTAFPIGSGNLIGIEQTKALVAAAIIMNLSVRVSSLSKATSGELSERATNFGYSFILSIYFLSFFAVMTHFLKNDFSIGGFTVPPIPKSDLMPILIILIFGPLVSAIISESLLFITGVDKENKNDYSP